MKIDLLHAPPADIFKNRGKYIVLFVLFLAVACVGLLLGTYAILSDTQHDILEKASMFLFVGSALPFFIVGEKLQAYKRLTPQQEKELADFCQEYGEVQAYCQHVAALNRRIIQAEFDACKDFAEEREMQEEQKKDRALKAEKKKK